MQFLESCVWFGGLVFVSMLHSVVHDLKAVLMPYLLPILLNFSDMPGYSLGLSKNINRS